MMNGNREAPTRETAVRRLERIGAQLRESGVAELAEEIDTVIDELRQERHPVAGPPLNGEQLLTTGEAAEMLGIRSLNTIKKWAIDGMLEGRRLGRRVMITRASVERLLRQPLVSEERAHETAEEEAWEPFDIGDHPPLPIEPWAGRKPWQPPPADAANE